jgi:hypothetical protein
VSQERDQTEKKPVKVIPEPEDDPDRMKGTAKSLP